MKSGVVLIALWCTLAMSSLSAQQTVARPLSPPSRTAEHLPASPSVLATVVAEVQTDGSRPEVLVLWRGSPKWYLAGPQRSSGGGGRTGFQVDQSYGDTDVSLQLLSSPSRVVINGVEATDSSANVFLVDGVDDKRTKPTVKAIRVPMTGDNLLAAAVAAAASPVVREFLRCPNPVASAELPLSLVCSRLDRLQ